MSKQDDIIVSFIIPHKGREELLKETLRGISLQVFDLKKIEVIIVTQNKKLDLDSASYPFFIKILSESEDKTISYLRNKGAQIARGTYFAFIDADVFLSSNWLKVMLEEIRRKDVKMVCAPQGVSNKPTNIEKIRVALNRTKSGKFIDFTGGWNLFLRKEDFFKSGGFPEDIITCEDYYFCDRVNKLGKIYCTSKANFIHLGEDKNWKELFKKEIWRANGNIKSIKGRKITLKEIPSVIVPIWIILFAILSITGILSGNFLLFVFGIFLVFLPVIVYSIRLYRISANINFFTILKFYLVYFMARSIGTVIGIFLKE
ncbi:glycosyltransferase family 2 protein [Desulfothermus naphthae]